MEECELSMLGGHPPHDGMAQHSAGSSRLLPSSRRPACINALPAGISQNQEEAAVSGQSLLLNK